MLTKTVDGFHITEEDLELCGPDGLSSQRQHGPPRSGIADLTVDIQMLKGAQ